MDTGFENGMECTRNNWDGDSKQDRARFSAACQKETTSTQRSKVMTLRVAEVVGSLLLL